MKRKHGKFAILVCTALMACSLAGCGEEEEVATVTSVAIVEAQSPTVGDLGLSASFVATLSPDESVYVIPKTTAEVLAVNVSAGDTVEEGDVLAVLDDTMAQLSMRSAQLNLDNAQRSYNLQYGEGAQTLNDIQTDSTLSQTEDGIEQLQESYVDAMDSLQKYKDKLVETQKELDDLKDKKKTLENTRDNADTMTISGMADYATSVYGLQQVESGITSLESVVSQYKQAIDQYEDTVETLQDQIDSTYNTYSQTVTSTNISNGELRDEQKKVSENSIAAARLSIEQAQESLDAYTITATISGTIEAVNIDVHDYATSSNYAFVISNRDTMIATYYVSEDVRNTFSEGQTVRIEKDDKVYTGEVVEIGGTLDQTTGLFKIKAAVSGDTQGLLSGTKATVITDTYHETNAVIIPYDAVYYDGTQAYVYTVVDGKAKKTNIETGLYDNDNIVVTSGLTANDTVITTWASQLRDGVDVEIKNTQE